MPSALPKKFSLCFSIIKRPRLSSSTSAATATSDDLHPPSSPAATTTSSSSHPPHYFKTCNSLYETKSSSSDQEPSSSAADEDMLDAGESTPDFATAYASHRFFFASPGRSNSIIDSSSSSSSEPDSANPAPTGGGVAVQTYSPDPYGDFRRSMEEMVEARGIHDVGESWNSLHELLLCYLSLNPKPTHQFIVAAFSDLLVSLMPLPPPLPEDGAALPPACLGVCRCSSH